MTSFGIKTLGILTMILDHLGFMFFTENIYLRLLGRLSFPLFAFQLAVGYSHSKSKEKHILRMLLFAIISQLPFILFIAEGSPETGHFLNIGFSFTLGLLGMYAFDNIKQPLLKILMTLSTIFLGYIMPIDYGYFGVALSIIFYIFRSNRIASVISGGTLVILKLIIEQSFVKVPMLGALIPIWSYNGKKGLDNKFSKYFFYIFYPLHMIIFSIIHFNI